jgi:hypothetical protein
MFEFSLMLTKFKRMVIFSKALFVLDRKQL